MGLVLVFLCVLMSLSTTFQLYRGSQFYPFHCNIFAVEIQLTLILFCSWIVLYSNILSANYIYFEYFANKLQFILTGAIYYPNPLPQDVLCGYFQNKCDCRGIRAHCVDQTCCNPHRIHVKKTTFTTQDKDDDDE